MKVRAPAEKLRNFGLDLARAIAILLVLVSHGAVLLNDVITETSRTLMLYLGGYFGVELFFVLSGFLIGGLLLRLFCQDGPVTWRAMRDFWARRWFRTLPTYYLFLLLNLTLFHEWFGTGEFDLRHVLFLQNLAWPGSTLMPESWSLAVEEWFYLTIPLVLWIFVRYSRNRQRATLYALCSYILVFTGVRVVMAALGDPVWDAGVRKVVLLRLDAIAWGCLMAWLVRFYAPWVARHVRSMTFIGASLVVLSVYFVIDGVLQSFQTDLHRTMLFTFTSAGLALLLPAFTAWSRGPARWPWLVAAITHISLVSYSAYLVHFSFVLPLLQLPWVATHLPWLMVYGLYMGMTIGLSTLIYRWYEFPMTGLRDRLVYSPALHR